MISTFSSSTAPGPDTETAARSPLTIFEFRTVSAPAFVIDLLIRYPSRTVPAGTVDGPVYVVSVTPAGTPVVCGVGRAVPLGNVGGTTGGWVVVVGAGGWVVVVVGGFVVVVGVGGRVVVGAGGWVVVGGTGAATPAFWTWNRADWTRLLL